MESILLYGSRARGDERPDSDIDILVVLKDDFNYSEMLRLSSDLTASLSLEKARRSQKAAAKLFKDSDVDFAASRAYYSLFYTAEALLLSRGLSFSSH